MASIPQQTHSTVSVEQFASLFQAVVTKIDPKYLAIYDNYRDFENLHLQQGDREVRHRKQTVNTRLFITGSVD